MTAFQGITTIAARVAFIRDRLASDNAWACRGLVRVYEAQTADEQAMGATVVHNGIGFTGADAEFLTSLAKQYLARGSLSGKQLDVLRRKMPKYAAQLERVAREKIQARDAAA